MEVHETIESVSGRSVLRLLPLIIDKNEEGNVGRRRARRPPGGTVVARRTRVQSSQLVHVLNKQGLKSMLLQCSLSAETWHSYDYA